MFRGKQHRWSVLLVFAVVVAAIPTAFAGEDGTPSTEDLAPEPEAISLSLGDWNGWAWAGGSARTISGPMTFDWDGSIDAEFEFFVGDGVVTGNWTLDGSTDNHIEGTVQGQFVTIDNALTFGGGGSVSGSNKVLVLDGESRSVGTSVLASGGDSMSFPVDSTSTIPTLQAEVIHALCEEVHGQWVYSIEQVFEEQGFTTNLLGTWFAAKDRAAAEEALQQLLGDIEAGRTPVGTRADAFDSIASLIAMSNNLVDTWPNWDLDSVLQILDGAERWLAFLRNLTECELRFFGAGNVEQFATGLTHSIQNLIIGFPLKVDEPGVGKAFLHLVHVATRTGAIGPGALNPALALQVEQALIEKGEAILTANVDPDDGFIVVNDETTAVMLGGALLGLTFNVPGPDGDISWNARKTYNAAVNEGTIKGESS